MLSMTGYGHGQHEWQAIVIQAQITSYNRKQRDIRCRLPSILQYLETDIQARCAQVISRGSVQVTVDIHDSRSASGYTVHIDRGLAEQYLKAIKTVQTELELAGDITIQDLLRHENILTLQTPQIPTDSLTDTVMAAIDNAITNWTAMRQREGDNLKTDLLERHTQLIKLLNKLQAVAPMVPQQSHERLWQRLNNAGLEINLDDDRLLKEIVILVDRSDVTEELTRLGSHLDQVLDICNVNTPVGRKLDFLIQELFREINTIGSKANHQDITATVVEFKTELERWREQVQNIE